MLLNNTFSSYEELVATVNELATTLPYNLRHYCTTYNFSIYELYSDDRIGMLVN